MLTPPPVHSWGLDLEAYPASRHSSRHTFSRISIPCVPYYRFCRRVVSYCTPTLEARNVTSLFALRLSSLSLPRRFTACHNCYYCTNLRALVSSAFLKRCKRPVSPPAPFAWTGCAQTPFITALSCARARAAAASGCDVAVADAAPDIKTSGGAVKSSIHQRIARVFVHVLMLYIFIRLRSGSYIACLPYACTYLVVSWLIRDYPRWIS